MSTLKWRRFLLSLCALAFVLTACELWLTLSGGGTVGVHVGHATNVPLHPAITVDAQSPAWRAGLRTGDTIDLRAMTPAQRYRLFTFPRAGESLHLTVFRDGLAGRVTIKVVDHPYAWDNWVGFAGFVWMILFATILCWRRPDSAEARVLALLLLFYVIGTVLAPNNWLTPSPLADAFVAAVAIIVYVVSFALLAAYAMLFARPPTILRRLLAWLSYASAAAAAVYFLFGMVVMWTAFIDPTGFFTVPAAAIVSNAIFVLFPLLCALAAIKQSRGEERTRLLWASSPVLLLYAATLIGAVVFPFNAPWDSYLFEAGNVAVFLAPLGLTYSLLNRRLLDIGFVLNRAAVFSGVSIVLVGAFVLVEWLLSEWLRDASHETNIAVSAALALLLGLSIRFVHARVEHVVDHVMFRERREDEEAIRKIAREAPYITDEETLLERVRYTLVKHASASFVNVLLDDGSGHYGGINENDPALVTLRAEHARVDLHAIQTGLHGEWAYPMVARGRLVGALVLGPKKSQESYAPDESAAISVLAHSVAGALDVLSMQTPGDALDAMRGSLDALGIAIAQMPAAIARELRGAPVE